MLFFYYHLCNLRFWEDYWVVLIEWNCCVLQSSADAEHTSFVQEEFNCWIFPLIASPWPFVNFWISSGK